MSVNHFDLVPQVNRALTITTPEQLHSSSKENTNLHIIFNRVMEAIMFLKENIAYEPISIDDECFPPPIKTKDEIPTAEEISSWMEKHCVSLNHLNIGARLNFSSYKMSSSKLTTLPYEFFLLEAPDLSCNPDFKFRRYDLDLSGNQFESLPSLFERYRDLQTLNLNDNNFKEFPHVVTKLTQLRHFYLGNNEIKVLPEEIRKLKKLIELSLRKCAISNLPKEIIQLTSLIKLEVSENHLKSLPIGFGELVNLKLLYLRRNKFEELSPEILLLKRLQVLDLDENQIKELPANIGSLKTLQDLLIKKNQLGEFPESITELTQLSRFEFSNNPNLTISEKVQAFVNQIEAEKFS